MGILVNFPARGRLCGGIEKEENKYEQNTPDFSAQHGEVQDLSLTAESKGA